MREDPERRLRSLLEKAFEVESIAVATYMRALRDLAAVGALVPEAAETFRRMILDSLLHRNIVRALLETLDDMEEAERQLSRITVEHGSPVEPEYQLSFLRRIVDEHDRIEEDMARLYEEAARLMPSRLAEAIVKGIAEDEKNHDRYLEGLAKTLEKKQGTQ